MTAPWPWQNLSLSTVGSCKIKSKSNTSLLQEGNTGAQSDHSKTRFQLCKPHDAQCLGSTHGPPGSSSGLGSLTPSVLPTACLLSAGMFHPTAAAVLGGCPTEVAAGWRSFFVMEANLCLLYDLTHPSIFLCKSTGLPYGFSFSAASEARAPHASENMSHGTHYFPLKMELLPQQTCKQCFIQKPCFLLVWFVIVGLPSKYEQAHTVQLLWAETTQHTQGGLH